MVLSRASERARERASERKRERERAIERARERERESKRTKEREREGSERRGQVDCQLTRDLDSVAVSRAHVCYNGRVTRFPHHASLAPTRPRYATIAATTIPLAFPLHSCLHHYQPILFVRVYDAMGARSATQPVNEHVTRQSARHRAGCVRSNACLGIPSPSPIPSIR